MTRTWKRDLFKGDSPAVKLWAMRPITLGVGTTPVGWGDNGSEMAKLGIASHKLGCRFFGIFGDKNSN